MAIWGQTLDPLCHCRICLRCMLFGGMGNRCIKTQKASKKSTNGKPCPWHCLTPKKICYL